MPKPTPARSRLAPLPLPNPGTYQIETISRQTCSRLKADGLSVRQIASKLQCNRFLVEKALREEKTP